jgi:hypothetical protein
VPSITRKDLIFRQVLAIITLPAFWLLLAWYKLVKGREGQAWVTGGHRGRLRADNAGALHDHIATKTEQPCFWIGNDGTYPDALVRHSWRARLAIAKAPVLIYSHGEDDLDICLPVCRGLTGLRVNASHGANLVKLGLMHPDVIRRRPPGLRLAAHLLSADYELLLCQSDLEKQCWDANSPAKANRHVICGGARIDALLPLTRHPPEREIIWFPTFRDTPSCKQVLFEAIKATVSNQRLKAWLKQTGRHLYVGLHVNSGGYGNITIPEGFAISLLDAEGLPGRLPRAELLITDYSSVLVDWLLFDRPAVFFPFDLEAYSAVRGFHLPYGDYVYGQEVHTVTELVDVLIQKRWASTAADRKRRAHLKQRFLGNPDQTNATRCFECIVSHVSRGEYLLP